MFQLKCLINKAVLKRNILFERPYFCRRHLSRQELVAPSGIPICINIISFGQTAKEMVNCLINISILQNIPELYLLRVIFIIIII